MMVRTVENWQYPQLLTIEAGLILMSLSIFVIIPDALKEGKKYTFLELRDKVHNMFLCLDSCSWNQSRIFPFKGYF